MSNSSDPVTMVDSNVLAVVRAEIEKGGYMMAQSSPHGGQASNEIVLAFSKQDRPDKPLEERFARAEAWIFLSFQPSTVQVSMRARNEAFGPEVLNKRSVDAIRDWLSGMMRELEKRKARERGAE